MKKFFYLLMLTGILFTACKKDDDSEDSQGDEQSQTLAPTQEQRGFAINYTGSWCYYCGQWGAGLIHDYANEAPDGAVICAHTGDPMSNPLFNSFTSDRTTGGGVPSFWVGDVKIDQDNVNSAMPALLNQTPVAGVDFNYSVKDGEMKVDVMVKFFEQTQGDYYLSVLVLEDGIPGGNDAPSDYQQNGTSDPNYKHDFVLRASATGNLAYGESIAVNPAKDEEVTKSYTINVESSWDDIYAVCIVWKYDNSNGKPYYKYINSLKKK